MFMLDPLCLEYEIPQNVHAIEVQWSAVRILVEFIMTFISRSTPQTRLIFEPPYVKIGQYIHACLEGLHPSDQCWERADILAHLNVVFSCIFAISPYGVPGQMW